VALVVLLRGVNVGGHKRFRPTEFAQALDHLDAVNVGSTGVFVVRRRISRTRLRAEVAARLPIETEIMICDAQHLVAQLSHPAFANPSVRPDQVRFVSVFARRPTLEPRLPMSLPSHGRWVVRILASDAKLALGVHRREMKAIGYLGALDELFGTPATTRGLGTLRAIAAALGGAPS